MSKHVHDHTYDCGHACDQATEMAYLVSEIKGAYHL